MVLMLGFLAVISVLVLAFFTSVSDELVASQSAAAGAATRHLSETAVNLVMAQIADATAGRDPAASANAGSIAWASQPGMIRTYTAQGNPLRYYKLYSAREMVLSEFPGGTFDSKAEFAGDVPPEWVSRPAAYTDLNAPVRGADGRFSYPIVDPSAQKSAATANDGVDGFEIVAPPGFTGSSTRPNPADAAYNPAASRAANPAPMPVRWLYLLQDGTVTAAPDTGVSGQVLTWSSQEKSPSPSAANPIVGRIAFWTDDETAKVNINTSSEGTFWDRPWGPKTIAEENNFAERIPVQNEFQRYPGHPAMTCLSPVLGFLGITSKEKYYALVPRIAEGGTKGGTVRFTGTLRSDNERLFASVDELAYGPTVSSRGRRAADAIPTAVAHDTLEKAKFFLTAQSRAPEVNLFNKPRISLWPIQADKGRARNAKDRLIAFCTSTTAADGSVIPYYFQRLTHYTGTWKEYKTGAAFPSSQSPLQDWEAIPRNRVLWSYLQQLTNQEVPGFGGSFRNKYETEGPEYSDRDQILTSAFDYIRSSVNTYSTWKNSANPSTHVKYDYAPSRLADGARPGESQVAPIIIRKVKAGAPVVEKGFGRFATVTEAAVIFYQQTVGAGTDLRRYLRAAVLLEEFNPTPGAPCWSPLVRHQIIGLEKFQVKGPGLAGEARSRMSPLGFYAPAAPEDAPWNWVTSRIGYLSGAGHNMAFSGMFGTLRYAAGERKDAPKTLGRSGAADRYPFYSDALVEIADQGSTFDFSGGPLEIKIYSGYEEVPPGSHPSADLLVQTLRLDFPPATNLPVPDAGGEAQEGDFGARIAKGAGAVIDEAHDTVRSVEIRPDGPAAGDLRYNTALWNVPAAFFVPHPKYHTGAAMAHSLRSDDGIAGAQDNTATLVPGATYNIAPAAARGTAAAMNRGGPGDFDNATGGNEDGAYINKADEGNVWNSEIGGYFIRSNFLTEDGASFSPNRQIASAVNFGSLPTGIRRTEKAILAGRMQSKDGHPWQTLLFTPHPAARTTPHGFGVGTVPRHPGFGTAMATAANPAAARNQPPYSLPPDHLFLDLFTMPIVEPYAISEPFSTAGKVNLNYEIAPFSYIKRTTGVRAVLKSVKLTAIGTSQPDKGDIRRFDLNTDVGPTPEGRGGKLEGNLNGTLYGFWEKFESGDLFRSASQICDISLVPADGAATYQGMIDFWNRYRRTGDNVREIPYGHIYPRVTTKSNTFTVHFRVQALRKAGARNADHQVWDESRDQVIGEMRGSTTLERYIDAAGTALPDFAQDSTATLEPYYRFRVLQTRQFTP